MNNNKENTNYGTLDTRVGRLEGLVTTLAHEVKETSQTIRELVNHFTDFKENILKNISRATAPKWPLIVSIGTLLLTILGLGGTIVALLMSGQQSSLNRHAEELATINAKITAQNYDNGILAQWMKQTDKAMEALDERLQKEMTLINNTTESKLKGLDDKLQIEFAGMNGTTQARIANLKEDYDNIRQWRLTFVADHEKRMGKLEGTVEDLKKCADRNLDKILSIAEQSKK
jgi:hypothetical protein